MSSSFYSNYYNTRQSSKVLKLPIYDKSISSNMTSQADMHRSSLANTPFKMNSPVNRSIKPRGDVANLTTVNSKKKKPQQAKAGPNTTSHKSNLQNQSLKSILDQTKKFVPSVSNYGLKQSDWSRASFTPMSTK